MENTIVIHTDGGSRGNPGPAACAFTVEVDGKEIESGSKYLGETTNNQAEYAGVLLALDWLEKNLNDNDSEVRFVLDSELIVKQINGVYRVKDAEIKKVFDKVISKVSALRNTASFHHVKRDQNKEADALVNLELDKNH